MSTTDIMIFILYVLIAIVLVLLVIRIRYAIKDHIESKENNLKQMNSAKTPMTLDELIELLTKLRDMHPEIKYECVYKTKPGCDDPEENLEYVDKCNFYTIAGSNAFIINTIDQ